MFSLDHNSDHLCIKLSTSRPVISSAVLNGGIIKARQILNLKVPKNSDVCESPEKTLLKYCAERKWEGPTVGMMTAASMESFRSVQIKENDLDIYVAVTAGLSNPRRVGDSADFRKTETVAPKADTINIIAVTSVKMDEAGMVEAVMIATEAKAVAMETLRVKSGVSDKICTGTGTDAIAIVTGYGPLQARYCGKHTLFGEILGRAVIEAVRASAQWDLERKETV